MRVLLLSVVVAGVLAASSTALPGTGGAGLAAPKIRFEGREKGADGKLSLLRFSAVNGNRGPVSVIAYLADPSIPGQSTTISPIYCVEMERDGKWAPLRQGWSGTGSGWVPIAPGAMRTFTIQMPHGKWSRLKAGLSWSPSSEGAGGGTVWSNPVTRSVIEGASSPSAGTK